MPSEVATSVSEVAALRSPRSSLERKPLTVLPPCHSHCAEESSEGEDSSELPSSSESASSHYSLFSDPESDTSVVSEISLQESTQPVKTSGLHKSRDANRVYHHWNPSESSSESLSYLSPPESKSFPWPTSPSSEENFSPTEDSVLRIESFPDWSQSSRRPPSVGILGHNIHVPAHSGHVAVVGSTVVVASGHHIKYYDISSSDTPSWVLDTRDYMGTSLVSCLEFKPVRGDSDEGKRLWVGTKEGHLLEIDVHTGAFTSLKGMHGARVTDIFRHGSRMITVDETRKILVFDSDSDSSLSIESMDDDLVYRPPQVYKLEAKPEFVKPLGGFLWTAVRMEMNCTGTAVAWIYDIHTGAYIGRADIANENAGTVTSGTILPSQPDHVYLGHEGGYISTWNILAGDDGLPVCVDVVKVDTSDVLCLEGVHDRLWAGSRKGRITVYDVATKPWAITNCWDAHCGLPVKRIFVDPHAIVKKRKLVVVSVGQDEQVKFWDGLLGVDRIEREMLKREGAYSTSRDLKVLIVSWNIDAAQPESLMEDPESARFLHDVLTSVDSPDIISFGFQEVIDLESRTIAAKTILLGSKKKGDRGKIDEKVTPNYKQWHDQLIQAVKLAMPPDTPYTVVHTESLVGLFTCMFVKNTLEASVNDIAIATIKRGMGGHYGNKGAIIARLSINDSSMCFINCHLAAGQNHVRQRNADVAAILDETNAFPVASAPELGYVGGGDGSMVSDHEIVFLNGDMNYRIDQRRDDAIAAVQADDLASLLIHDQLRKEMKRNPAFPLRVFNEGPLTFSPTYKYDRHANTYDSSEKQRVPAWCDRVLWRSRKEEAVALMEYRRWEPNVSDHRPVSAAFRVTVKKVVGEAREREKWAVEEWWRGMEDALLADARAFYAAQAVVNELQR